jgi:hypothetical protein
LGEGGRTFCLAPEELHLEQFYMAYVTLTGDYGYKEYWIKNASDTTYDATSADFHIAAKETVPAINIYDSKGIVINGGEIWGEVSMTANWTDIYNHMSTGFRISNSPNTTIRNVRIDGTWDGIRFIPDDTLKVANGNSNGWLVEDVHMSNIRDDAIENDFAATGTLRDSLLDGVFSAFGTVNAESAHGVLTLDDDIIEEFSQGRRHDSRLAVQVQHHRSGEQPGTAHREHHHRGGRPHPQRHIATEGSVEPPHGVVGQLLPEPVRHEVRVELSAAAEGLHRPSGPGRARLLGK